MNKTLISTLAIMTVIAVAPATTLALTAMNQYDQYNSIASAGAITDTNGERLSTPLMEAGTTQTANEETMGSKGANDFAQFEAYPEFTLNEYTISAGKYLKANTTTGTQCPANSYCVGGSFDFNEKTDQGKEACPSTYPNSDAGTTTADNCYKNCTMTGAKTVSGRDYQNALDTCEATACNYGYHLNAKKCELNNYSVAFFDGDNTSTIGTTQYIKFGQTFTAPSTAATKPGHTFRGWRIWYTPSGKPAAPQIPVNQQN